MTLLFYKPFGVVSQFSPLGGHKTLSDFGLPKGVYPCGRLDHDSEGLLVLTDDGRLQNRLSDPRFNVPRTYWAQVEKIPRPESLSRMAAGLALKDGPTKPCQAKLLVQEPRIAERTPPIRFRKNIPTAWIEITLTEGRNRQVRRMTAAIGHPTLRLFRLSHGSFRIDRLNPGEWRSFVIK
ncbi:MAG: pseudouridine synthase [Elusimicrobiota bacterium]